ncbi:MAG TPA: ATP-binding cassette domain-containing protein [Polyangia bacterium]|nr:ATP-binding cassette domain-containing protein [Polyangia bacterium]
MTSPILRLAAVSKTFGEVAAIHEATLDIDAHRTTVLIGPSGGGKTTALRLMLGLVRPDAGQVLHRDAPLGAGGASGLRRFRSQTGYVVQDGGLFPHLTAAGNVTLMARHLGWPRERAAARVAELAALVRLPGATLVRYPQELSGGQRQRVALMRALMLDPELLFLDEPLGALDPLVRAELQDELVAIFRRLGKSVVIVTHDLAEAALFGDVLVLIHQGRVVQRGSLDDLVHRPASPFVTQFVRAQRRFDGAPGERGA